MDPDSDLEGPKASESDGSGFATLLILKYFYVVIFCIIKLTGRPPEQSAQPPDPKPAAQCHHRD